MDKIKLAIAEDNVKFRRATIELINQEDDIEVMLEVDNGKQLIEKLKKTTPHIVVMDAGTPHDIEATAKVRKQYPQIKIIVFLHTAVESSIIEMNIQGVKGFLAKEDDSDELLTAIRIVQGGGVYMPSWVATILQRCLSELFSRLTEENRFYSIMTSQLSKTELKVLWLSSQHKSIKKIAEIL